MVAGLFSLARKIRPSIIFIDEIDSILRQRSRNDHDATATMKGQLLTSVISAYFFMLCVTTHVDCSLWDGLLSGSDQISVLGATNRMQDIDPAFLRRMPKRISISVPDVVQREKILSLVSPTQNRAMIPGKNPFLHWLSIFSTSD